MKFKAGDRVRIIGNFASLGSTGIVLSATTARFIVVQLDKPIVTKMKVNGKSYKERITQFPFREDELELIDLKPNPEWGKIWEGNTK